jgi:hypothetical protein
LWANLANNYTSNKLKFLYINIEILEDLAYSKNVKFKGILTQLPVLVLYENGKEVQRYPANDSKGNPYQVKYYRERDIVRYFNLDMIKIN